MKNQAIYNGVAIIRKRYVDEIREAQDVVSDAYERGMISYSEMNDRKNEIFGKLTDECIQSVRHFCLNVDAV